MSKNIAIITDSSFNLSEDHIKNYGIYTVPVPLIFHGRVRYSSDWSNPAKFFKEMNSAKELPTTSQPSPADVISVFDQVKKAGYRQAIFLCLSAGISGFYNSLLNLAGDYQGLDVTVWDSKSTLRVAGAQALLAAELSAQGKNIDQIIEKLTILRDSTNIYLIVDDINHLKRTGRLAGGAALVAGLLNIKPILHFDDQGKIVAVAKERQMRRVFRWLLKKFESQRADFDQPIRIMFADANNRELTEEWRKEFSQRYPDLTIEMISIDPMIGVHTGEKAVGFVYMDDWKALAKAE